MTNSRWVYWRRIAMIKLNALAARIRGHGDFSGTTRPCPGPHKCDDRSGIDHSHLMPGAMDYLMRRRRD